MEENEENTSGNSKTGSCIGKLLNILFIVGLIVGGYFGYLYIKDNFLAPKDESAIKETQENENQKSAEESEENQTTGENGGTKVEIMEISEEPLERINFQKVGTVFPYKSVTVNSETAGTVSNMDYSEGDEVKKGQKLADISDSVATEIAEINYESALKTLELARESLESTRNSINQDIRSAAIGVESAILNYENAIEGYNNLSASLDEQVKQAKLGVQAAETGLLAAQKNYYTSTSSSHITLNNTLDQSLGGVASSLSLVDNALDTAESLFDYDDLLGDYISKSRVNSLENDIEDAKDEYRDLLDEYEDARNSNSVQEIKNLIDDCTDLLEFTEDILNDTKYIIDDLLDEDEEDVNAVSQILISMKSGINILIPSLDQSKGSLKLSKSGIDTVLSTTQIQPEGAFTQLETAEQQLNAARLTVQQAETGRKSQLDTAQNGIDLAKKQLDTARAQLENIKSKGKLQEIGSETQVAQVESQVDIAAANLGTSEVESPLDGVILNLYIEEGNYINPSQRIMTVADMSKVKVVVSLTTEELSYVKLGQTVSIEAPGGIKTQGRITKVLPAVNPVSKKVDVEIIIKNDDEKLKSGMFTDVLFIDAQKSSPTIYVPFKSIIFDGGKTYIYCVENSKAVKKEVEIGQISGSNVEITSGIRKGAKVITNGAKLVSDGDLVSY